MCFPASLFPNASAEGFRASYHCVIMQLRSPLVPAICHQQGLQTWATISKAQRGLHSFSSFFPAITNPHIFPLPNLDELYCPIPFLLLSPLVWEWHSLLRAWFLFDVRTNHPTAEVSCRGKVTRQHRPADGAQTTGGVLRERQEVRVGASPWNCPMPVKPQPIDASQCGTPNTVHNPHCGTHYRTDKSLNRTH